MFNGIVWVTNLNMSDIKVEPVEPTESVSSNTLQSDVRPVFVLFWICVCYLDSILSHNLIFILFQDQLIYKCELDPETETTLHIYLYKDVRNVGEIRKNILSGLWKCVMIKPALIMDPLQVAIAANRAVISEKRNTMATRNVFTEILYNLSLTKNIGKSLSKFGIENDTDLLVCFLITPGNDNSNEILAKIKGKPSQIQNLQNLRDLYKIKSVYKFNDLKCDVSLREMLQVIISRMASKDIISY